MAGTAADTHPALAHIVVELFDEDSGDAIGQVQAAIDWEPAIHDTQFARIRQRPDEPAVLPADPPLIAPVWDARRGEPYLDGFTVELAVDERSCTRTFTTDYFRSAAREATREFVADGRMAAGQRFRFQVFAMEAHRQGDPASTRRFQVAHEPHRLRLVTASRRALDEASAPYGPAHDDDVPVIVPKHVIDEAIDAMRAAGENETGGVLLGFLHRDVNGGDVFLRVTDQIPLEHTEATSSSLTFTPDTWTAMDGLIRMRGDDEQVLGWWHSHPARAWCSKCPVENREKCPRSGEFFSADDALVHRSAFARAYSLALVISDSYADGITYPMFGWRRGRLQHRGFRILKPAGVNEP